MHEYQPTVVEAAAIRDLAELVESGEFPEYRPALRRHRRLHTTSVVLYGAGMIAIIVGLLFHPTFIALGGVGAIVIGLAFGFAAEGNRRFRALVRERYGAVVKDMKKPGPTVRFPDGTGPTPQLPSAFKAAARSPRA